ncbi:MAG: nickel pincer cofactor biosynthesis protein LarC [Candidatus Sumerlaeaceae bacterium]|jgi:uncharacterized protein (TIGR00299 family) protein
MKSAHFDCYSGISGDMVLGAFLDVGVPLEELRRALASLPIEGYSISAQRVLRGGIIATQAIVECQHQHHHRGFGEIQSIISNSELPSSVKERAIACFRLLAEAEATVHKMPMEKVQFHEVGALDAIVDIVGAMWCYEYLGIGHATASEIVVGSGRVRAAHGELPVPAPATALLLRGVPITDGGRKGELTTPTGAAILRTLVSEFAQPWHLKIEQVGYGAGGREDKGFSNCLRVFLGDSADELPLERRELVLLQTEIDDMTGELFGYLQERLFAAGALDVAFAPIQMKKNRPAVSVQCLTTPEQVQSILEVLLRESTTFGVKVIPCDRYCLRRELHEVPTPWGPVRMKVGFWGDQVLKITPEFEDCRRIAREKNVPLADVFAIANRSAMRWLEERWEKSVPAIE